MAAPEAHPCRLQGCSHYGSSANDGYCSIHNPALPANWEPFHCPYKKDFGNKFLQQQVPSHETEKHGQAFLEVKSCCDGGKVPPRSRPTALPNARIGHVAVIRGFTGLGVIVDTGYEDIHIARPDLVTVTVHFPEYCVGEMKLRCSQPLCTKTVHREDVYTFGDALAAVEGQHQHRDMERERILVQLASAKDKARVAAAEVEALTEQLQRFDDNEPRLS